MTAGPINPLQQAGRRDRPDAKRRLQIGRILASLCIAAASAAASAQEPVGASASDPAWPARDPEVIHEESIEVLRQRIESLQREADSANRGIAAMQTQLREAEE